MHHFLTHSTLSSQDFVMTIVASEDRSRPIRSSCPWVGYTSGVELLTGFPNGNKLVPKPPSPPTPPQNNPAAVAVVDASGYVLSGEDREAHHQSLLGRHPLRDDSPWPGGGDIHGPYQHGGLFPAVNGGGSMFTPPVVVGVQPRFPVGTTQQGYFRTETGCSVLFVCLTHPSLFAMRVHATQTLTPAPPPFTQIVLRVNVCHALSRKLGDTYSTVPRSELSL